MFNGTHNGRGFFLWANRIVSYQVISEYFVRTKKPYLRLLGVRGKPHNSRPSFLFLNPWDDVWQSLSKSPPREVSTVVNCVK